MPAFAFPDVRFLRFCAASVGRRGGPGGAEATAAALKARWERSRADLQEFGAAFESFRAATKSFSAASK
jgi:hypothetical protein